MIDKLEMPFKPTDAAVVRLCKEVAAVAAVAEVTPTMIEAGFAVLSKSGIVDGPMEADKLVLVEIYQAMLAARS